MAGLVEYLLLIAALCLAWFLLGLGMRLLVGDHPAWLRRILRVRDRWRRPATPPPTPLVLHELELTRLAAMVAATYESVQPARAFRVNAASAAYDMELVEACRSLGVDAPDGHPPLTPRDRFETESRLLAAGLHW